MSAQDLVYLLTWYFMFIILGIVSLPISLKIFSSFPDRGYALSKILGIVLITYAVFILSMTRIVQFNFLTIFLVMAGVFVMSLFLALKKPTENSVKRLKLFLTSYIGIIIFEEILFFIALYFLSYIRAFAPEIHGLEKYMDYGFINSILRSEYLPPKDMWFTPLSINYYYFGHLATAVITKLSGLPSQITYNLMLASIFAMAVTASFSLLFTWISTLTNHIVKVRFGFALLGSLILSLGGNLHTIYTFFAPYENESPIPPWRLVFQPLEFPNNYWYPNATRFIANTIHEFPMYSWTVSDLHGHVLDIPFVLLTIALVYAFYTRFSKSQVVHKKNALRTKIRFLFFIGFLLSVMYMTNAWDGIIYFLLAFFVVFIIEYFSSDDSFDGLAHILERLRIRTSSKGILHTILNTCLSMAVVGIGFFFFALPFSIAFKPFVSGIGVLCAPSFLTDIGKIGPFLFEANHCQHSPFWQLFILHGFFYLFVAIFGFIIWKTKKRTKTDIFVLILIILSTILILVPEFIYAKDIYPGHYRANTMFKLVFQSFMMLSLATGYILFRFFLLIKERNGPLSAKSAFAVLGVLILLSLIFIYPFQAINSYYAELKTYQGLDGTAYLQPLYPDDYKAIQWMQKNISGQPVILEAQGDSYNGASSYTDYARVSANTGLPTILGWTVHEWLWRGSYDIPAPRIEEIRLIYESENPEEKAGLLEKYNVSYVFVGQLEREKYPYLDEAYFGQIGDVVFEQGQTKIYKLK